VSAQVLELPARVRCDRAARELREGATGVLKEIHRHGGDAAFHRAAPDLEASVAATVAHVEGRQHMLDVLGLIDRATEAWPARCDDGPPPLHGAFDGEGAIR
jgi:hypothetical protein